MAEGWLGPQLLHQTERIGVWDTDESQREPVGHRLAREVGALA